MTLRLNQHHPLVWRTPSSLQFGIDHPSVVLSSVSNAEERMIAALRIGVTRPGLSVLAAEAGADAADVVRLLRRLSPVLERAPAEPAPRSVVVAGSGHTVRRILRTLGDEALTVRTVEGDPAAQAPATTDLAIMVAHYVLTPAYYGHWLRRDVPHLPVIFGDEEVRIGPMIEPGTGPCLHCIDRWRTDRDSAWPAIASQLWGTFSRAETTLVSCEVAALASRIAVSRLKNGPRSVATSLHLDAATGRLRKRTWLPHPKCGCVGIERLLAG